MYLYTSYHCHLQAGKFVPCVNAIVEALKSFPTPSHLLVRGISGQSVAWPVSYLTGIPVAVVRKPGENAHTGTKPVIGAGNLTLYIMIDDQVDTGSTIKAMMNEIPSDIPCYGLILWNEATFSPEAFGLPPSLKTKTVCVQGAWK